MAIDGGQRNKLDAGTKLVARYKGVEHTAEVVTAEDSKLRFRLADGREFKSPSAAASALMGGISANGWRWWSIADGSEPAKASVAAKKPAAKPAAPRRAAPKRRAAPPQPEPAVADPDGIERVPID